MFKRSKTQKLYPIAKEVPPVLKTGEVNRIQRSINAYTF